MQKAPELETFAARRAPTTGYAATKAKEAPARNHLLLLALERMARTLVQITKLSKRPQRAYVRGLALPIPDEIGQQDETTNHQYSNPTPKIAPVPFQDPPICTDNLSCPARSTTADSKAARGGQLADPLQIVLRKVRNFVSVIDVAPRGQAGMLLAELSA
jgi:hypothetical protein